MSGHDGEARQSTNTSQRLPAPSRGAKMAVWAWLAAPIGLEALFGSYLPRTLHARLAYGMISLALALVAILLIPVIAKTPAALGRAVYVFAGVDLLLVAPSVWGSAVVVDALFAIAGYHVAIFVAIIIGVCLWALLFLPLASLVGRLAAHT